MNNANALLMPLTMYAMKRDYGTPVVICKLVTATTDLTTGVATESVTAYRVKRGVVLPEGYNRTRRRDREGFPEGGVLDVETTTILIDAKDVKGLTQLTADDWVVIGTKKYQIVTATKYVGGFVIDATELVGEVPSLSLAASATSTIVPFGHS